MLFNKRKIRRNFRRRRRAAPPRKRANLRVARPLRAVSFRFKRQFQEIVYLQNPVTNWTPEAKGLYRQFVYALNELPGYTDFTALFASYRLTGVKVDMYFSNTGSTTMQEGNYVANSQILLRTAPWPNGQTQALTEDQMLETSSTKTQLALKNNGRPCTSFTKLRQLSNTYQAALTPPDYVMVRPKWIATTEVATPHYGLNVRLDRVDGQDFTTGFENGQFMRIIHTVYLETRQVQ